MKVESSFKSLVGIVFLLLFFTMCNSENEISSLSVITKEVSDITTNSAKCGGKVSYTGNFTVGACGSCWGKSPSPTVNDFFTTDIQGQGEFVSSLKNLEPNTKYYVRAYATTSSGIMYGEEYDFCTESLPEVGITVITSDVTTITSSSAITGGSLIVEGDAVVKCKGVCWNSTNTPGINDNHTVDGQGNEPFISHLINLKENTHYCVRAYATMSDDITFYGNEKYFTTISGGGSPANFATVILGEVTNINGNSARCSAEVTNDGNAEVTEYGLCWSTSANPMVYHFHVKCGSGTGSYSAELTDLDPGTTYHVRAYALNSVGTSYSEGERVFTTWSKPEVSATEVTNIQYTTATGGGVVSSTGGAPSIVRGLCWSTSPEPTSHDNYFIASGSETGAFTVQMSNLTPGTKYYVRAFATNAVGTKYSNQVSFTTATPMGNGWLYYDDGVFVTSYRAGEGAVTKWGVKFPVTSVAPYYGCNIKNVKVYIPYTGQYSLRIYEGGSLSPGTLVYSKSFSPTSTGWANVTVDGGVALNSSKELWVTLAFLCGSSDYPAACSNGVNNRNARWFYSGDSWIDISQFSTVDDLSWMIRVYLSNSSGSDAFEL